MVDESKTRPIVVKKVVKGEAGHHGGSWKIAFADFMTAMFAIFLVLWLLLALDEDQRAGVGQYFRDPTAVHEPVSPDVIDFEGERRAPIDLEGMPIGDAREDWLTTEEMQQVAEDFQDAVLDDPDLDEYRDQILVDITEDGMRIQLVDEDGQPMFDVGSADPLPHTQEILSALAGALAEVPNPVSIAGHTDARPFPGDDYDNWSLSADRADAARRLLLAGGLPRERIGQVVGYADSMPFDPDNPRDPINRRISMVLMSPSAVEQITERERRAAEGQSIEMLPRRPRELLTPEERRRQEEIEEAAPPGAEAAPEGPDGGEELIEPDELPARGEAQEPEPETEEDGEAEGPEIEIPEPEGPEPLETW